MATPALLPALATNPITLAIGGAIAAVKTLFSFKAAHAQAVKTEAAALNQAVPTVEQSFANTFYLYNTGSATASQADQAIDASLSGYDSLVYSTYGVKKKTGNGPDVLKNFLQGIATKAKALIDSGQSGSVNVDALPSHAGFAGTPAFTLNASKASSSVLTSPSGGISLIGLLLLGAVVLWLISRF